MNVLEVLLKALDWAKERDYAGYDPFDALSSPIFYRMAGNSRTAKIFFTQLNKNSPFNLRPIIGIEPERNPKGIALYASAYHRLYGLYGKKEYLRKRDILIKWLLDQGTREDDVIYWGYNFPWQCRRSFLPQNKGCSVVTFFAAEAAMDAGVKRILEPVANFYLKKLNILYVNREHMCLSYTPYEKEEKVVNANALIGYQLTRIGNITGKKRYKVKGKKLINWVVSQQQDNGGWIYSPNSHLGMDNFHNGYVIWALIKYYRMDRNSRVKESIFKGLKFYETLFDEGRPLYSTEKDYPLDIHNCAQGIITFKEATQQGLYKEDRHKEILKWTLDNMWDPEKSYFYYQKNRLWTNKIPYMRWSQAWMCYAIGVMLQA